MNSLRKITPTFSKLGDSNIKTLENSLKRFLSVAPTKNDELHVENLDGKHSGVTVIGMNRPERKNALGMHLMDKMDMELDKVRYEAKARVLIIRSLVGGIFCSGADLKERLNMSINEMGQFHFRLKSVLNRIHNLPIPVIAAMDGAALGGGLELALSCDLRVASRCAKIGLVETKHAIIPGAGGTQRLPRLINPAIAKELIFSARVIDGQKAHELGILNHVVEQNKEGNSSYLKSLELCEEILRNGPIALRMAKQAINNGLETDITTGFAIEAACYAQTTPTKDRREALEAFQAKRKPIFRGE